MVRKTLGIGVVGALAALMVVSLAMAQPGGGGGGGRGGPGGGMGGGGGFGGGMGGGRGMMDPSARADNTLEQLNITGDAAKAIKPKLEKVFQLQQQVATPRGGRGGRMGGGMGGPGGGAAAPETEVSKARAALQTAVENTSAKPEDITKALTAYRAARQKAQAELTAAQADLKKVLTPAQEAQLVLQGVLE